MEKWSYSISASGMYFWPPTRFLKSPQYAHACPYSYITLAEGIMNWRTFLFLPTRGNQEQGSTPTLGGSALFSSIRIYTHVSSQHQVMEILYGANVEKQQEVYSSVYHIKITLWVSHFLYCLHHFSIHQPTSEETLLCSIHWPVDLEIM